jgi:hypothetical protein
MPWRHIRRKPDGLQSVHFVRRKFMTRCSSIFFSLRSAFVHFPKLTGIVLAIFSFLIVEPPAAAQGNGIGNTTSTPVAGVPHDYITGLTDTVNPANGALSIRIKEPLPQERGENWPTYAFVYDSNLQFQLAPNWFIYESGNEDVSTLQALTYAPLSPTSNAPGTLTNAYPTLSACIQNNQNGCTQYACTVYSGYTYTDADGGQHALGIQVGVPSVGGPNACTVLGFGGNYLEGGDTQYKAIATSSGALHLVDSHGNVPVVEDTNGNYRNSTGRTPSQIRPGPYTTQTEVVNYSQSFNKYVVSSGSNSLGCSLTSITPVASGQNGNSLSFNGAKSVTLPNIHFSTTPPLVS